MKFFLSVLKFLYFVREKIVRFLVALLFYGSRGGLSLVLCLVPLFIGAFVLGAYVPIFGIYSAFVESLVLMKEYIDESQENNQNV